MPHGQVSRDSSATRVAYVVNSFPHLSETFVLNEILEVQRRGYHVEIFAMERTQESIAQPGARELALRATFLEELSPGSRLRFTARALSRPRLIVQELAAARRRHPQQGWHARRSLWLAGALLDKRISHVHAHFASAMAQRALPASRIAGCTFTMTTHGYDVLRDPIAGLAAFVNATDGTVAVAETLRTTLIEARGASPDKLFIQPCGVDTTRFTAAPSALAVPGRVLTVARLSREKDLATAVEAAALMERRGVHFEWHIIGEGPERARLQALIAERGVQHRVQLIGAANSDAVRNAMAACSVFALCSLSEGAPLVLMEAMASGRAVVATAVGGVPDVVADGATGLLVPAADPQALAAAVSRVLASPNLACQLGDAGQLRVETRFSLAAQVDTVTALWRAAESTRLSAGWPARFTPDDR